MLVARLRESIGDAAADEAIQEMLATHQTNTTVADDAPNAREEQPAEFANDEDERTTKALLFDVTRHYWVGIEDDMKRWAQENWRRWEEEKPEWFTDNVKARIPVEWIPTAESRKRESERRLSMRRPSLLESMAGEGIRKNSSI